MNSTNPTYYMSLALQLAEQGRYTVSPNPMVGCVIVKNNQIIGQGYHQRAGEAHAEVFALKEAGDQAKDATAYVTLEPCCHYGRTPPCTNALISSGIKKVYVACLDPNPLMAGKGVDTLRAAGIEVEIGCNKTEAQSLNEIFFHYIRHQRPFVIAKWAMSLDGKTITNLNDNRQISSVESQQHTHELRHRVDSILVGARTAIYDNPQLTVRLKNKKSHKQPLRIVLAGHERLPHDLKLFGQDLPGKTIVATCCKESVAEIPSHIEILYLPESNGQVCLTALLDELGKREITSLLVEGGMSVHVSFFNENLVNKTQVYIAPVIIGTLAKKRPLRVLESLTIGGDQFFSCDGDPYV